MDEHDFLTALRQYWMDTWVDPTRYLWSDDEEPGPMDEPWLRLTIRSEGNERRGIGRLREEPRGLVMVEVMVPRKTGTGPGERLAAAVAAVWRAFRHTRIRLDAPSVVGLAADGAFNRHLVTLGWRGDMRLAQ